VPNSHDMTTELPYDEVTAADFRIGIAQAAYAAQGQYGDLITKRGQLTDQERDLRMAAMYASGFGWSLVAIIGWIEKNHGADAAWSAAAMAQDVMTNGGNSFCEDIPYPPTGGQVSTGDRPNPPGRSDG
jgi:hypothetical protein